MKMRSREGRQWLVHSVLATRRARTVHRLARRGQGNLPVETVVMSFNTEKGKNELNVDQQEVIRKITVCPYIGIQCSC